MEDEFQGGICGESWWNSTKNVFTWPCLSPSSSLNNLDGAFAWPRDHVETKRSLGDDYDQFGSDNSADRQDITPFSSPATVDCIEAFLHANEISDSNYIPMLHEPNSSLNYQQESGMFNQRKQRESSTKPPYSMNLQENQSSMLLHNEFNADNAESPKSLLDNQPVNPNYEMNLDEFSPSSPKWSSLLKSSFPEQPPLDRFPLTQSQFLDILSYQKPNDTEVCILSSMLKKVNRTEPAFKRLRIETPSSLPTFKVRKEKMGDRITALQQLVSPFGKTDTASVLHDAVEYIKYLHDQVNAMSTPYMKKGSPNQPEQTSYTIKDQKYPKHDLRSRGLCVVPIPSTFTVAAHTKSDRWTSMF